MGSMWMRREHGVAYAGRGGCPRWQNGKRRKAEVASVVRKEAFTWTSIRLLPHGGLVYRAGPSGRGPGLEQ